jgi:hypothetical protein
VRRIIERILLAAIVFAMTGFVLLVLIGLWDRLEKQADNEADGRYLAPQAVSSCDSDANAEHAPHVAVGRDRLGPARVLEGTNQGMSVALSADGSTAIAGGPGPHNADLGRSPFVGPAGAAWVFRRSYGVWTQQGNKLVGTTNECGGGLWSQGASVALSADGNTAIVGGPSDNKTMGAAWVFARTGGVWTQQGSKLVGTDAPRVGDSPSPTGQGMAVALSADGNTAVVLGLVNIFTLTRRCQRAKNPDMAIVKITGGMLRAARSLAGLSQQEVADRASRPGKAQVAAGRARWRWCRLSA